MNELQVLIGAGRRGRLAARAARQYVDFACIAREGSALEDQLVLARTPRRHARGIDCRSITRPAEQTHRGSGSASAARAGRRLVGRCRPRGGDPVHDLRRGVFASARYTGQEDILLGTPIAGRTNRLLEGWSAASSTCSSCARTFREPIVSRTARPCARNGARRLQPCRGPVREAGRRSHPQRDMSRSPLFR